MTQDISKSLRWFQGKSLVARIRGADYAHAGEEEAITLCLENFPKDKNRLILDVGCGLGGTASFIQQAGWGKVTGFDVEKASIDYARNAYPAVEFFTADVVEAHKILPNRKFDLICLFNSFYAFSDQKLALQSLRLLAQENARLLIFEYVDFTPDNNHPLVTNRDPMTTFLPIRLDTINSIAVAAGWNLMQQRDLSTEYKHWFARLLQRIKENQQSLTNEFGEQIYMIAVNRYTKLFDAVKNKSLGGALFTFNTENSKRPYKS